MVFSPVFRGECCRDSVDNAYSCYAPTREGLMEHIACCLKHYPLANIKGVRIRKPQPPTLCHYSVDMFINRETPCNCPQLDEEKACVRVNNISLAERLTHPDPIVRAIGRLLSLKE